MKHLHETFTNQEFTDLQKAKLESELNWHDFMLILVDVINLIHNYFLNRELGRDEIPEIEDLIEKINQKVKHKEEVKTE